MPLPRGYRIDMEQHIAFAKGLVLSGEIEPDFEFQSEEDRSRNRERRQRKDEATGKLMWKGKLTDPDEPKAKRASFEVHFIADVQPVPSTEEVLPGMRQIELEGLQLTPKLGGQGEYKYLTYDVWATGIKDVRAGRKNGGASGSSTAAGSQSGQAAA